MMILWLIVIGLLIYYLFNNNSSTVNKVDKPMQILDERFARGEINEDEYSKMKRTLESRF
jgi:putative membrane protein